jgi:hypothetical protein
MASADPDLRYALPKAILPIVEKRGVKNAAEKTDIGKQLSHAVTRHGIEIWSMTAPVPTGSIFFLSYNTFQKNHYINVDDYFISAMEKAEPLTVLDHIVTKAVARIDRNLEGDYNICIRLKSNKHMDKRNALLEKLGAAPLVNKRVFGITGEQIDHLLASKANQQITGDELYGYSHCELKSFDGLYKGRSVVDVQFEDLDLEDQDEEKTRIAVVNELRNFRQVQRADNVNFVIDEQNAAQMNLMDFIKAGEVLYSRHPLQIWLLNKGLRKDQPDAQSTKKSTDKNDGQLLSAKEMEEIKEIEQQVSDMEKGESSKHRKLRPKP